MMPLFLPEHAEQCGFLLGAHFALQVNAKKTAEHRRVGPVLAKQINDKFSALVSGLSSKTLPAIGFTPDQIQTYGETARRTFRALIARDGAPIGAGSRVSIAQLH